MEYTPHTLSNGRTILYRRVSPFLGRALSEQYPEPRPPVHKVNYGTPEAPEWGEEPNTAHPDYLAAMREHSNLMEKRANRLYLKRGTAVEWTPEKKAELADLREYSKEAELTLEGEGDDTFQYVLYVVCDSLTVYQELVNLVVGASQPSEGAIQAEVNGFRPEVQGA